LIGDSNVGKTSIINSYKQREDLSDITPTIGVEFTNTDPIKVGSFSEELIFQIWDTGFFCLDKIHKKTFF